ncbi:MAG: type II secretion system F family protein [Luteolibacter sp.]
MTSKAAHKHLFYLEMAKLLEAGFDIRKAAAVLMDTRLPPVQAALLRDLNRGLEAGQSITAAFASDTTTVSELERSMISAGERGGNLAPAFQHLSDYFGMLASARGEMIKSMIYPLVVLHMGIFIGIVPTAMMRGDSFLNILGQLAVALVVFYTAALVVFVVIRAVLRAAPENVAVDRFLHRIPLVGKARQKVAMARFCKVYHSCILAGISMSETAEVASSASQSAMIREAGKRLVKTAQAGSPLGPAFVADGAFPNAFSRSYSTGEEAGTLDKDLERWAKLFQTESEAAAKTLSIAIPKLLYFFILGFVAWKIISFFNGYYSGMLEEIDK